MNNDPFIRDFVTLNKLVVTIYQGVHITYFKFTNIKINITYSRQLSTNYLFGIISLRLTWERIENRLYMPQSGFKPETYYSPLPEFARQPRPVLKFLLFLVKNLLAIFQKMHFKNFEPFFFFSSYKLFVKLSFFKLS